MTTKSRYSIDRIAQILADADTLGDRPAATQNGVSRQGIAKWRKQLATDAELHAAYDALKQRQLDDWHAERRRALHRGLLRAQELLATERNLDKVTRFLEKVGGVDIARQVLGGGDAADPGCEGASGPGEADGEGPSDAAGAAH